MNNLLRAGAMSAFAAVMLTGAATNSAFAQQVQARLPVVQAPIVQAVVRAAASPITAPAATPVIQAPSIAQLVDAHRVGAPLDEQGQCLATAVYFEAMGESLEGQLAVANVVINRANSKRYPTSWCAVVKQKAQFSFVRNGRFPSIDPNCQAWAKAQAIARIAALNLRSALPSDVLWYHADYVAPKWRRNLTRVEKIGAHIFYRS